MSDKKQQEVVLDHDYDGIREQDNRLPNWWLATLLIAIVFGFAYWLWYQTLKAGPTPKQEYLANVQRAADDAEARAKASGVVDDALLLTMSKNPTTVARGQATFQKLCVACHGAQGQGVIGPNLTDDYWLHGAKPTDILKTISGGVPSKGMPNWEASLGPDGVEAVAVYVLSIKGKHVPGKEPQGELAANLPAATTGANP